MNDRSPTVPITLSIAAVERDTGLSKDTLRVWERRYGFPMPERDGIGERAYTLDQVEKLRLIKRLMDAGHRPGRIVPLPFAELSVLSDQIADPAPRARGSSGRLADLRGHIELLRRHDREALRAELTRLMATLGLGRFVTEIVAPLNTAIGDAWIRGQLEIFEEHLYTETVQTVLRQGLATLPAPAGGGPDVLLTTFPGEPHGLGLLMAEAVLSIEGCRCTSLGVQTPLWDIVLAARAHRAHVVALSFTGCMNPNQIVDGLSELRSKLPGAVEIWAGGSAPVLHRRRVDGVQPLGALDLIGAEVERWRASAALTGA